jgi:hypothetical protein
VQKLLGRAESGLFWMRLVMRCSPGIHSADTCMNAGRADQRAEHRDDAGIATDT